MAVRSTTSDSANSWVRPCWRRIQPDSDYDELVDVVEHYLVTDLEANVAIYYGDVGVDFEPAYLERME